MKKLLTIATSIVLLQSCHHPHDPVPDKAPGSFNLAIRPAADPEGAGRVLAFALPPSARLIMTIEKEGAAPARDTVDLLVLGDQIVGRPIDLDEGDYMLTELLVIGENEDGADEIFYAAPSAGHPLEGLVDQPLPIPFVIHSGQVTVLTAQLVKAAYFSAEDLGYFTVDLELVNHFFISVFAPNDQGLAFTEARAAIIRDGDTIKTMALSAELNLVNYSGEADSPFTLVVTKSGYARYSKEFTLETIRSTFDYSIIQIPLVPALTFAAVPEHSAGTYPFSFSVTGDVTVDWGDGNSESFDDTNEEFYHEYDHPGEYFVCVTGNLNEIERFYSYYGQGPLKDLNLMHLTGLEDFRNGWNGSVVSPSIIDLSHNTKIAYLDVSLSNHLEGLNIPSDNRILNLLIFGPNSLTEDAVDHIINPVYESVVATDRQWGNISLEYESVENSLVPISDETLEKLRELKNTYGWTIEPDPDR